MGDERIVESDMMEEKDMVDEDVRGDAGDNS